MPLGSSHKCRLDLLNHGNISWKPSVTYIWQRCNKGQWGWALTIGRSQQLEAHRRAPHWRRSGEKSTFQVDSLHGLPYFSSSQYNSSRTIAISLNGSMTPEPLSRSYLHISRELAVLHIQSRAHYRGTTKLWAEDTTVNGIMDLNGPMLKTSSLLFSVKKTEYVSDRSKVDFSYPWSPPGTEIEIRYERARQGAKGEEHLVKSSNYKGNDRVVIKSKLFYGTIDHNLCNICRDQTSLSCE